MIQLPLAFGLEPSARLQIDLFSFITLVNFTQLGMKERLASVSCHT